MSQQIKDYNRQMEMIKKEPSEISKTDKYYNWSEKFLRELSNRLEMVGERISVHESKSREIF